MICFETNICGKALDFFKEKIIVLSDFKDANQLLFEVCGVRNFFTIQEDFEELCMQIRKNDSVIAEDDRREYGDFQTNNNLALQVSTYASLKNPNAEFILEPTCGKGSFILASLQNFKKIKKIVGVEIYLPYVWETKIRVLSFYLDNVDLYKPVIDIIHADAFQYDYNLLASSTKRMNTVVIGNPPWITNSELASINSMNLPPKSNFKNFKGMDAITGKGNFDIGEYISVNLIEAFQKHQGLFAFLIKNSVVKNLIYCQKVYQYTIGNCEMLNIDSKKEFNASVKSSLFIATLNTAPEIKCEEYDFYTKDRVTTFGWYKNKFVYSVDDYDFSSIVDGQSPFTWRSGVKHDCSKVMEIEQNGDNYANSLGDDNIEIEENLVYGLLKSSDLKLLETNKFRKLTIITQKNVGQDTKYIEEQLPLTFKYLNSHKDFFASRKSSIYTGKPEFSIFGIGDYSFAKYKIAISGLYKTTHFTLVHPNSCKPIMLDDTCYFIGFDDLKTSQITHYLLNSIIVQKFLKSITFTDSKRPINKDNLMRIDIYKVFMNTDFCDARAEIGNLTIEDWNAYSRQFESSPIRQTSLF